MNEYKDKFDKTAYDCYSNIAKDSDNIISNISKEDVTLFCEARQIPVNWLVEELINNCFNEII